MIKVLKEILDNNGVDIRDVNKELLYQAGMDNIMENVSYYHDKNYTCKSVLRKLFVEGVLRELQK